jgi:CBS domain-containing protein
MKVIKIATVPPPAVQVTASVEEAVPIMGSGHGCAVAVMDGERLVGTISRDEVLQRIIGAGLNAGTTKVGEIMNSPAETVPAGTDTDEALRWMLENKKCYLGIVDAEGRLKGWLAICSLFQDHMQDLTRELDSLVAYYSADGPGG